MSSMDCIKGYHDYRLRGGSHFSDGGMFAFLLVSHFEGEVVEGS